MCLCTSLHVLWAFGSLIRLFGPVGYWSVMEQWKCMQTICIFKPAERINSIRYWPYELWESQLLSHKCWTGNSLFEPLGETNHKWLLFNTSNVSSKQTKWRANGDFSEEKRPSLIWTVSPLELSNCAQVCNRKSLDLNVKLNFSANSSTGKLSEISYRHSLYSWKIL